MMNGQRLPNDTQHIDFRLLNFFQCHVASFAVLSQNRPEILKTWWMVN
jgi:hypothetical protein